MTAGGASPGRPARAVFLAAAGLVLAASAARAAYQDELIGRARSLGLAEERRWHRLLHYRAAGKGWRSEADGQKFFLAPRGRTEPAAELEAAITSFFEPAPPKGQHPQCRFPARYHWLKAKLAFDPARLPERSCPDFEAWRGAIDAEAVSVVYASAFLNNPASMFGHTFLRLHRRGAGDALLDYTINFAATPDTRNVLLSTLRGLNGSFKGEYSLQPFYMKTQEYGSLEMRDLWDYRLRLPQARIDALIRHGWEMGSTYFNYYFFTKNCSYQLLTLLEAADESLDLSAGFPGTVKPADTVRALLAQPGLVETARYRPSYVSEIKARRARLAPGELHAATALGKRVDEAALRGLDAYPPASRTLVLDSAHDYLRYRFGFYAQETAEFLKDEHALLRARGRLGPAAGAAEVPEPKPLEAGHAASRAGLGFGVSGRSSFEELAWRAALHDLASHDEGYIPDSHLEMGAVRLRFDNEEREPYLERLDLIRIVSLSPWDPWIKKPSWKLSTGVDQAKELGCSAASCMFYGANLGGGLSAATGLWRRELFYLMAETDLGLGPVMPRGWRAGGGGSAGLIVDLSASWRLLGEAAYVAYGQGSPARQRLSLTSSLRLSRDAEARLVLDRRVPDEEAGLMFYLYF